MAGKVSKWRGGEGPEPRGKARRDAHEEYFCEYCGRVIDGAGVRAHLRHIRAEYSRAVRPIPAPLLPSIDPPVDCIEARHIEAVERLNPRSLLRRLGDWVAQVVILVAAIIFIAMTLGYIKRWR